MKVLNQTELNAVAGAADNYSTFRDTAAGIATGLGAAAGSELYGPYGAAIGGAIAGGGTKLILDNNEAISQGLYRQNEYGLPFAG